MFYSSDGSKVATDRKLPILLSIVFFCQAESIDIHIVYVVFSDVLHLGWVEKGDRPKIDNFVINRFLLSS